MNAFIHLVKLIILVMSRAYCLNNGFKAFLKFHNELRAFVTSRCDLKLLMLKKEDDRDKLL